MKKSLFSLMCPLFYLSVVLSSCSSGDGFGYCLGKVNMLQLIYGSNKTTCKTSNAYCYTGGSIASSAGSPIFQCLFEECTDFSGIFIMLLPKTSVERYSLNDIKVGDTFRSKNFECSIENPHALTDWWSQESKFFKAFDGKVTVVDKHTDGDKLSITLKLDGIKFNIDNDGGIILVNGFVNFKEIVVNY